MRIKRVFARILKQYDCMSILPRLDLIYGKVGEEPYCWLTIGWLFWGVSIVFKDYE